MTALPEPSASCREIGILQDAITRSRDLALHVRGSPARCEWFATTSGFLVNESERSVAEAYDARAAEYIGIAGSVDQMDARDRALIEQWRDATGGPLLDAGCGPGHWTELLSRGGREVRGVDLSEEFVAAARTAHPHVTFDVGSFARLPLETGSLGGILAWYSLIHTAPVDLPAVLAEFARVLRPGGGLLLGFFEGPAREPFAHAVTSAWYWSPEVLGSLLADAGFAVVRAGRRGRAPEEISARPHADIAAIRP